MDAERIRREAHAYALYHDAVRGYAGLLYFRGKGMVPGAGLLRSSVGYLVTPGACTRTVPMAR